MTALIQTKKLSHIALNTPNIERQTAFYTQMVGLDHHHTDKHGRVYLRCQKEHHSVVLYPANHVGMNHMALDVGGQSAFDAAVTALSNAGISLLDITTPEDGQSAACRFLDPDGFTVELVASLDQVDTTLPSRAVNPRRYGHLTLRTTDLQRIVNFYTEILGFRISDWLGDQFCWLRCTPEHHGIAISTHPRAPMMHHLAFHVRDMAELVQQAEHLMRNGRHLLYGPGRHGPGQNLFIYFHDEDENIVEFAADMQRIWDEENYTPKVWDPNERWSNMWGPPALPAFRE